MCTIIGRQLVHGMYIYIFSINISKQTLTSVSHYLRLATWFPSKKTIPKMRHARINSSIGAEHMGEALIPFYAMLDTRNAIWCPHPVSGEEETRCRRGDVGPRMAGWWMMLERVHACDETCYFIHKVGWDEEVYRVFKK